MFSTLRTRYGIPGLIATAALVFAMTGGAFAAKYLITSTNQIKPSVLKKLKGAAGPAGAPGAAGAQGPAGAAGAPGAKGATGETGATGEDGESVALSSASIGECSTGGTKLTVGADSKAVCNGAKGGAGPTGPEGPEGKPWTAGGTLPKEKTEVGVWSIVINQSNSVQRAQLSFPIPLASELKMPTPETSQVHYIDPTGKEVIFEGELKKDSAVCLGSVTNPTATAGHLCVYAASTTSILSETTTSESIRNPALPTVTPGASKAGAVLLLGAGAAAPAQAYGTWAVTAP